MTPGNRKDFFVYQTQITLAAGISGATTVAIEADSNFWLQKLTFNAINSATSAVVTSPNMLVMITDTGSGRQLMNTPVPVPALFGTGELPFILPNPRRFMRNSSIAFAFTSYEAANGTTLRVDLIGYKEYGTD